MASKAIPVALKPLPGPPAPAPASCSTGVLPADVPAAVALHADVGVAHALLHVRSGHVSRDFDLSFLNSNSS